MPHMLKYVGPKGLYLNIKGLPFLVTKIATRLCFCTVKGLYHAHIQNGRTPHMLKSMGCRAPNANMMCVFFLSNQYCHWALVWCDNRA